MLTGTETRPKEMVAVPMDLAAMVSRGEGAEVGTDESQAHHKYFNRGKLFPLYSYAGHQWAQVAPPARVFRGPILGPTGQSPHPTFGLSLSARSRRCPKSF